MKCMFSSIFTGVVLLGVSTNTLIAGVNSDSGIKVVLSEKVSSALKDQKILFIERNQYARDHHNTATLFQYGEINQDKFDPGAAMRVLDVNSKVVKTLLETKDGIIRDPEISFDGKKVLFSMRKKKDDFYHIYEMNIDGTGLKQLTFAEGISDIDPIYLPDGDIVFTSTRQPKYCMCNRHIMGNLFRMEADGANINQIGVSTLFEGHASLLQDGRIMYDRWEYVDRNFGDAQGLWVVNPDGTKHAIYYGNNTVSPGGVLDARQIPGTDNVVCVFSSCHDRPWGAMAIIDRKKGVDGIEPVVEIWPKESIKFVGKGSLDSFKLISNMYEDPYPLNSDCFLVSRTIWFTRGKGKYGIDKSKSGIYFVNRDGTEELILEGELSLFDPMSVTPKKKPNVIPNTRNYDSTNGHFYVDNVYEGTHMQGVELGSVKYLRVVESPEKRTWTKRDWKGQGAQAPGMNWHSFENKQILGEIEVEEDGSTSFIVPSGKHVFFQLLDRDKKMIQSMRSGVSLMPGEVYGCIGCHDDRLSTVSAGRKRSLALKKKPQQLKLWKNEEPHKFSFMEEVQPIFDKHCVKCHDFDRNDRNKLVLAGDKNPYFNAAYVNLNVKKVVKLIGGGPAEIQPAYSWGSHASKLTKIIDGKHHKVKLSDEEKETLYTWMDLNGVYYPIYESSFGNNLAGRCPLNDDEIKTLSKLTGINFNVLNKYDRKLTAQVSFDRPEESLCLDAIRNDKSKYDEAVAIISKGMRRLEETPRGDIESEISLSDRDKIQLEKYSFRLAEEYKNKRSIAVGEKYYERKD